MICHLAHMQHRLCRLHTYVLMDALYKSSLSLASFQTRPAGNKATLSEEEQHQDSSRHDLPGQAAAERQSRELDNQVAADRKAVVRRVSRFAVFIDGLTVKPREAVFEGTIHGYGQMLRRY